MLRVVDECRGSKEDGRGRRISCDRTNGNAVVEGRACVIDWVNFTL